MRQKLTAFASKLGVPFSAGAVAGAVATAPMTLLMLLLQRMLPHQRHRALPPEKIVNALTRRIGVRKRLDKEQRLGVALASHFGYGASMGTLYIPFRRRVPLPPILKGAAFGLVVWVESYLGLLPALRVDDREMCAKVTLRLIDDRELGKQAHIHVKNNYLLPTMVSQYLHALKRALKRRAGEA